jgi:hypothetical protein
MGKRDDLIAKYANDLRTKCKIEPDMALLTKVTIGCGPAIYSADAETVAASDKAELERVKASFLIKKLGLADGPALDEAIKAVVRDLWPVRTQQVPRGRLLHADQALREGKGLRLIPAGLTTVQVEFSRLRF